MTPDSFVLWVRRIVRQAEFIRPVDSPEASRKDQAGSRRCAARSREGWR